MNEDELYVRPIGDNQVKFSPIDVFEVDGIQYNPWSINHCSRPIVSIATGHDVCPIMPENCFFDSGADRHAVDGEVFSEAFRWKPGMVYYRSDRFETPAYGG